MARCCDGSTTVSSGPGKSVGERLAKALPVEVGDHVLGIVIQGLGKRTVGNDEAVGLVNKCLTRAPATFWPRVARALSSTLDARAGVSLACALRSNGFPEASLVGPALAWADGDRARRRLAALLATSPRDAAESLGAALLDAFPADREVAQTLESAYFAGRYSGSAQSWAEAKLRDLVALSRSARRGLSGWARRLLPNARAQVDAARASDEWWQVDR